MKFLNERGCSGVYKFKEGMPILPTEDIRAFEVNAVWFGQPLLLLMENAGRSVADVIECKLGDLEGKRVVILAGRGGNGGDGITAGRHLALRGSNVEVYLLYNRKIIEHEDTKLNLNIVSLGETLKIKQVRSPTDLKPFDADVVIDAVLGIGVRGELREPVRSAMKAFNESSGLKVSIDVPTGVDPDTGNAAMGSAEAEVTVTMHAAKPGLLKDEAKRYVGELWVAEIGMIKEAMIYAGPGDVRFRIPERPKDSRKGVGGRVLIVGGSKYYFGAPALASLAAYRAGADLSFLAAPKNVAISAASWNPNIIPRALEGEIITEKSVDSIIKEAERVHAVALGPGLGLEEETVRAVEKIIEELQGKPLVIDADGLKAIAKLGTALWPNVILTPHRGEAAMLAGEDGEPEELAKKIAKEYSATVVVKGPIDYICEPSGRCRRNLTGVPSMSTGGTGDVLTGVTVAFLARRVSLKKDPKPLGVASASTFVVGEAGKRAFEVKGEGLTAVDVLEEVPRVICNARGTC